MCQGNLFKNGQLLYRSLHQDPNIHLLHLTHNISMPSNKTVNAVVNLGVVVPHLQETTVLLLALLLPSTSS